VYSGLNEVQVMSKLNLQSKSPAPRVKPELADEIPSIVAVPDRCREVAGNVAT
jgi:hypothetical protein